MAIVTEHFDVNGRDFVRTYSNRGMMVRGGFPETNYAEANDPAEFGRTYTETNIPIDTDDPDAAEIVAILTGEEQ